MTQEDRHFAGAYLPPGLPHPAATSDGLDAPYWEAVRRHALVVQRCESCQTYQWEPEWMCHACQSLAMGWTETPARGRIYAWTRVWHSVHPSLIEGIPYLVVVVELPEAGNVRMCGNLLGDPEQEIRSGDVVEAVFEDHPENDYTLVQWRIASN